MTDEWRNGYEITDLVNMTGKVSPYLLDRLRKQVGNILEDNPFILQLCPRLKDKGHLIDTACPYFIKAPLFRNCSLVANFFGPFTAREVAYMLDMTIDAVYDVEKSALKKLKGKLAKSFKKEDLL